MSWQAGKDGARYGRSPKTEALRLMRHAFSGWKGLGDENVLQAGRFGSSQEGIEVRTRLFLPG